MEIENISAHIEKLSKEEWSILFALIPIIESTQVFSTGGELIEDKNDQDSFNITPEFAIQIVYDFLDIMEELDLIIPFAWSKWALGKEIFEKGKYKNLNTITLLKLLTAFIRADHFCCGAGLASRFEDRTIEKILKEIKKNIESK
ncbi:MAG: DUF6508 domain-containing protein [Bacteroidota bacterium]|nr:DUF6508 domain-containing protein [Bacteroidota bacterium]